MAKKFLCMMLLILTLVMVFVACDSGSNGDDTLDDSTPSAHTHTFGEWETVKAATCTADGSKERYCDCGEKQTATIVQIAHNFSEWGVVKEATATEKGSEERSCACGKKETREIPVKEIVNTEEVQFNNACSLIAEGKFEQAYELLSGIKNYAPAKEKLANFFYAPQTVIETYGYTDSSLRQETYTYTYSEDGNILSYARGQNSYTNFTYNELGNVLSSHELPDYSVIYIYSYSGGVLSRVTNGYGEQWQYYYNDKGDVDHILYTYNNDTEIFTYQYTYYANGQIKTTTFNDDEDCINTYYYLENGKLEKIKIAWGDDFCVFTMEYGAYGLTAAEVVFSEFSDPVGEYTYLYDANGNLVEMSVVDEYASHVYSFSNYKLCYSENASTHERISKIYRTHPEEIIRFFD